MGWAPGGPSTTACQVGAVPGAWQWGISLCPGHLAGSPAGEDGWAADGRRNWHADGQPFRGAWVQLLCTHRPAGPRLAQPLGPTKKQPPRCFFAVFLPCFWVCVFLMFFVFWVLDFIRCFGLGYVCRTAQYYENNMGMAEAGSWNSCWRRRWLVGAVEWEWSWSKQPVSERCWPKQKNTPSDLAPRDHIYNFRGVCPVGSYKPIKTQITIGSYSEVALKHGHGAE